MLRTLVAAPLLLAGLLPVSPEMMAHWPVAGRWVCPVGDPRDVGLAGPDEDPGYSISRSVGGPSRHQGADLSNRREGGEVRAAAHGLVVAAGARRPGNGYGIHVVIAHRLPDGDLVYTVYAHLAPGSVQVRPGDTVLLGSSVGRVGMTGDARSPHLHFEVRLPRVPSERWEKTAAADPLEFVITRLPTREADSTWARPYLVWAESAGLLDPGDEAHGPLRRGAWRRMLAAAVAPRPEFGPPAPDDTPGDGDLASATDPPRDSAGVVGWDEIARDLERTRGAGVCLPRRPVSSERRREDLRLRLGVDSIAAGPGQLSRRRLPPTAAEACLAIAETAGD